MPGLGRIPKRWPGRYCWVCNVRCGGATRESNPTRRALRKKRTAAAAAATEIQSLQESHSADRKDKVFFGKLYKAKIEEMELRMREGADPVWKGDPVAAEVVLVVSLRIPCSHCYY